MGHDDQGRAASLDAELAPAERERVHLGAAIAAGGLLPGLLEALREREARRANLEAERDAARGACRLQTSEIALVRGELLDVAASWRQVLAGEPTHARPIVTSLLNGRVTFSPAHDPKRWIVKGEGVSLGCSQGFARRYGVPNGFEPVFWP